MRIRLVPYAPVGQQADPDALGDQDHDRRWSVHLEQFPGPDGPILEEAGDDLAGSIISVQANERLGREVAFDRFFLEFDRAEQGQWFFSDRIPDHAKAPIAIKAVRRIDQLFAVERDIAGRSAEAPLAAAQSAQRRS